MKIVLDAMGGDKGLGPIISGGLRAAREMGIEIVFVGRRPQIEQELGQHDAEGARFCIVHSDQVVEMSEEPGAAIRAKRDSSMVVGMGLVKTGEAAAFVSAGNSGGTLAAAQLQLGRITGIRRAALGTVFPTLDGRCFLLDIGATTDCKPAYLLQFGVMGSAYARGIMHVPEPRVGILSTGEEEGKGSLLVKEAYQLLKSARLNFLGNVEGKDVTDHLADVVVTDGFTGNVFIKTSEGVASLIMKTLQREIKRRPHAVVGAMLARGALRAARACLDYSDYGGAALLGVNGVAIVAHGRSDQKAIRNAVRVAKQSVDFDITAAIKEALV